MFQRAKVAVSRIVRPLRPKYNNNTNTPYSKADTPDSYDICIKAKAIAKSAGADKALSYALNRSVQKSSKPVLINTILTALSREGKAEKFWEVYAAKVEGNTSQDIQSPELVATVLNQIAKELQQINPPSNDQTQKLMYKATQIYIKALENLTSPNHLHLHNAYLKCISRTQNVPYLLWIINLLSKDKFKDINLNILGLKEYLPCDESSLKIFKLIGEFKKPVEFDSQSLTSILNTLSRSPDGSIQLAELIWSKFENTSTTLNTLDTSTTSNNCSIDKNAHLALLLVYRNDLSRLFSQRKLIRSTSWRERKHSRVLEIIKAANVDLSMDPKFLSIYFEICWNGKLKEKIGAFLKANAIRAKDERLQEIIKKFQKGNSLVSMNSVKSQKGNSLLSMNSVKSQKGNALLNMNKVKAQNGNALLKTA